jgi:murein DD-endopeptidase MepM/ murein hydrolase activator NlpD
MALALIAGGMGHAGAQAPPTVALQQETTTTVPNLLEAILGGLIPTTTTTTVAPAAPAPAPAGDQQPGGGGGGGGSPSPPSTSTTERTVPADAQRIINSVQRTGSNNTLALLEALRPLMDQGLTQEEAAIVGFGQFPVAGEAYWRDDWYEARFTPEFHFHKGTDIFAARGTPVRAPVDGRVEFASEGAGGLAAYVTAADGTYYYMAHLDRFPSDLRSGTMVKQGRVVGFTGSSGNAESGAPHVHLQIHPGGGAPVNPKPIIDRWVQEAIAGLRNVIPAYQAGLPRPLTVAGLLRRLDTGSLGGPTSADGPQLWAAAVRRDGGARITSEGASGQPAVAGRKLGEEEARAFDWLKAERMASEILGPLTPKVLRGAGHPDP